MRVELDLQELNDILEHELGEMISITHTEDGWLADVGVGNASYGHHPTLELALADVITTLCGSIFHLTTEVDDLQKEVDDLESDLIDDTRPED